MSTNNDQIIEKIQFKTDIITSYNGTEQRIGLRSVPRRYFSYKYDSMFNWESQYLRMLNSNQQNNAIYLPIWHRMSTLTKTVNVGSYYFNIDPYKLWGFKGTDSCFFYYGDNKNGSGAYYQTVAYNSDGSIRLKRPMSSIKELGWYVAPICKVVIQSDTQLEARFSRDTNSTINFEIINNDYSPMIPSVYDYEVDNNYGRMADPTRYKFQDKYNEIEIFKYEPTWNSDISFGFNKNAVKLDNDTGKFSYYIKSPLIQENRSFEIVTANLADTDNLQRFFYRRMGQLNPFYSPTWLSDITVDTDIKQSDGFISTSFSQYYLYYSNNQNRKTLIIFLKDMSTIILSIVGYTIYEDDNGERHGKIIVGDIPRDIPMSEIKMVSFLCKYRLTTDELETAFDTTRVGTTTLPLKEV